jgi:hypothetical protein
VKTKKKEMKQQTNQKTRRNKSEKKGNKNEHKTQRKTQRNNYAPFNTEAGAVVKVFGAENSIVEAELTVIVP